MNYNDRIWGEEAAIQVVRGNIALEGREWEQATGFFEEALNRDPMCAEAYLGKHLAQNYCSTMEEYINLRLIATTDAEEQKLLLQPGIGHINKIVELNTVEPYLPEEEIRKLYEYDLSYSSAVAARQQQRQDEERIWAENLNLSRAEKFATGEFAQKLGNSKEKLLQRFDQRIADARSREATEMTEVLTAYNDFLWKTDEMVLKKSAEAMLKRQAQYEQYSQIIEGNDSEKIQQAVYGLAAFGPYQDSPDLAVRGTQRLKELSKTKIAGKKAAKAPKEKTPVEKKEKPATKPNKERKTANIKILYGGIALVAAAAATVLVVKLIPEKPADTPAAAVIEEQVDPLQLQYEEAESLFAAGDYEKATDAYTALGDYKDAPDKILKCRYAVAEQMVEKQDWRNARAAFKALGDYEDSALRAKELLQKVPHGDTVQVGMESVVAVKNDGTVVGAGRNQFGQLNVESWTDVVAVYCGYYRTVGLRSDGTVLCTGRNLHGEAELSHWENIVEVSIHSATTYGLCADGTIVAAGLGDILGHNYTNWADIVFDSIRVRDVPEGQSVEVTAVGFEHDFHATWEGVCKVYESAMAYGLRPDGTVITLGNNFYGRGDVEQWTDIVALATTQNHVVGLKSDATMVATGYNVYGQCNVSQWTDVYAVYAASCDTYALLRNGTLLAAGKNEWGQYAATQWTDIRLPETE